MSGKLLMLICLELLNLSNNIILLMLHEVQSSSEAFKMGVEGVKSTKDGFKSNSSIKINRRETISYLSSLVSISYRLIALSMNLISP